MVELTADEIEMLESGGEVVKDVNVYGPEGEFSRLKRVVITYGNGD